MVKVLKYFDHILFICKLTHSPILLYKKGYICVYLKTLLKIKLWWINNRYTEEQTEYKYLAIINLLEPKFYANYEITDACMFKLNVLYSNLETYIAKINYINSCFNNNKSIGYNWCYYNYTMRNLDVFLIDNNLRYTDRIHLFKTYKNEYVEYCNHIIRCKDIQVGTEEHNVRILSELTAHLNSLTLKLLEFIYD